MVEEKKKKNEEKKEEKVVSAPKSKEEEKAEPVKKEVKAVKRESKSTEKKEKIELEREYVIPIRKNILTVPRYRRAKKAIMIIRIFLARHMKVEDRDIRKVKIDVFLNNEMWFRGIKNPWNKIKVKAVKKGGIVYAELADVPEKVKYDMERLLKRDKKVNKKEIKEVVKQETAEKEIKEERSDKSDELTEKEDAKSNAELDEKRQEIAAVEKKHTPKVKTGKEEKQSINRKALKR